MNELRPELDRHRHAGDAQRFTAAAGPVSSLQDQYGDAGALERIRRGEPRRAGADYQDVKLQDLRPSLR